jgi:hypothetical protein
MAPWACHTQVEMRMLEKGLGLLKEKVSECIHLDTWAVTFR